MLITTDKVYHFTFSSPFNTLDDFYLVQQIHSYDEIVANGIDMVKFLYGKVELTEDDYESDRLNYTGLWVSTQPGFKDDQFYKLSKRNVSDEEIIYVPESLLEDYPNPNVSQYNKMMIILDLGAFDNPDQLNTLPTAINEKIQVDFGIDTLPDIATYDKVWMKNSDYESIESSRESLRGNTVNYYSEALRLEEENKRLLSRIEALENIITS